MPQEATRGVQNTVLELYIQRYDDKIMYHPKWHPCESESESESEVAQSCPTLCDPMDCSLPGSSVYVILQARILEWVAISFSSRSSQPRDETQVSCIVYRCFTV